MFSFCDPSQDKQSNIEEVEWQSAFPRRGGEAAGGHTRAFEPGTQQPPPESFSLSSLSPTEGVPVSANFDRPLRIWESSAKEHGLLRATRGQALLPVLTLDQARTHFATMCRERSLPMPRIEVSEGGCIVLGRLKSAAPFAWEIPGTTHRPTDLPSLSAVPNRDEWEWAATLLPVVVSNPPHVKANPANPANAFPESKSTPADCK